MQNYLNRAEKSRVLRLLQQFPVVAILGPRQCGKSTLAKEILSSDSKPNLYLDLEKPSDLQKLSEPEFYLSQQKSKLVCIDEIQRSADLFPFLRSLVDEGSRAGQFLILGSASRELLKQSSESLAGRIAYVELSPFSVTETSEVEKLWVRGGFPGSFLAPTELDSVEWRIQFIRTFLEQDIPALGIGIQTPILRRFWQMIAHYHGQVANRSKIGDSLGVSHNTIQNYLNILEQTFMLRQLPAFSGNLKKRLVKSPKIYLRDSGLLHTLLGIEDLDDLSGHPTLGASWEGFAVENILKVLPNGFEASYYRSADGANEVDLVLKSHRNTYLIECKSSLSPKVSKGFQTVFRELEADKGYFVCPIQNGYSISEQVEVTSLQELIEHLRRA